MNRLNVRLFPKPIRLTFDKVTGKALVERGTEKSIELKT